MIQVVGAILAFALVFAVFRLVIIALVVAGLIFRTKETIGLLLFGGLLSLLAAYPVAGIAALAVPAVVAIIRVARREGSQAALLEHSLDDPDQE